MSKILLIILLIRLSLSQKYPKNIDILSSPKTSNPTAIDMTQKSEMFQYLQNYDYIIVVFHMDWCGHCQHFLPIFTEASSYQLAKKFKFLKINCNHKEICNAFKVDRFPTIKVYIKGNELKSTPPRELIPLLEFIEKLSTEPVIKVKDKTSFLNDYGHFSPYIEYSEKNTQFISCINILAKEEFLIDFYFGVKAINITNTNKEKVIFDYDGINIEYEWDNSCDNIKEFLNQNVFPLISQAEGEFFKKAKKSEKLTFLIFYNSDNSKQEQFVLNKLKVISKRHRNIIFGYLDAVKNPSLASYFKINFKTNMQILLYDFFRKKYYIHKKEFDVNGMEETKAIEEIEYLLNNLKEIKFTTGNFFQDLLISLGLEKIITYVPIILVVSVIVILTLLVVFLIICDKREVSKEKLKRKTQ